MGFTCWDGWEWDWVCLEKILRTENDVKSVSKDDDTPLDWMFYGSQEKAMDSLSKHDVADHDY